MTSLPEIGRCQRCKQIRPIWRLHADICLWTPDPDGLWPANDAWLCVSHYSDAKLSHEAGRPYRVDHGLEIRPWKAAKIRIWIGGYGELLSQADRDLAACNAILAATDELRGAL